jgi:hypothetical protein
VIVRADDLPALPGKDESILHELLRFLSAPHQSERQSIQGTGMSPPQAFDSFLR